MVGYSTFLKINFYWSTGILHFKLNSSGECVTECGYGAGRGGEGVGCSGRTSSSLGTGPGPELPKDSAVRWQ